jgi:hypothetical protein
MLFGYPTGVQGNVVSSGVNEFIIPLAQALKTVIVSAAEHSTRKAGESGRGAEPRSA